VPECLDRQHGPQAVRHPALARQLIEDRRVASRRGDDRDVRVVLGRRPDHRGAADVDLLDELVPRDPGPVGGRGERVEIHDDELERGDPGRDQRLPVGRPPAVGEDPAVDPRVERLDPPVEHLGKARDGRDVGDWQAGVAKGPRGAARRNELEAEIDEAPPERVEPRLVRNREQGPPANRRGCVGGRGVDADRAVRRGDGPRPDEPDGQWQQPVLHGPDPFVE
jgi:hypothetical protein